VPWIIKLTELATTHWPSPGRTAYLRAWPQGPVGWRAVQMTHIVATDGAAVWVPELSLAKVFATEEIARAAADRCRSKIGEARFVRLEFADWAGELLEREAAHAGGKGPRT